MVLRVLGLWCAEERLEGDEGRLDGEYRRPLGTEGIQANGALPTVSPAILYDLSGQTLTVTELTLGCQILVSNRMFGGRKG